MPRPMPWHSFSSTAKVARHMNGPPSLLANSAAVQNPKATSCHFSRGGRKTSDITIPYTFPFREGVSTDISLEDADNTRKLMHPSALHACSCKQESYY